MSNKIGKSDTIKDHNTLKSIITTLLWRNQHGVCFNCEDALDWEYNIISFEKNPKLTSMGIFCRSCFNKYRPKKKYK